MSLYDTIIPQQVFIIVTQSDKKGLIAGKYMCSLNNMYLHFFVSYNNSVKCSKISINFYISDEIFKWLSYHVYTKSYRVSSFEIMVKNWWAISPFLSDWVTIVNKGNSQ